MASISASTGGFDSMMASVRKQVTETWAHVERASQDTAEFGAKTAQSYTASRPGMTTGKAGRIDTGAMLRALRHKIVSVGPDHIQAQYGFVDEFEEYMRMQTVTGFTHNRSGNMIQPTFALRDSIAPVNEFARDAVKRGL